MNLDLDLYRKDVIVAESPRRVRLSVIDLALKNPPARTMLFIHGFGGYARQWKNQLNFFADDSRVVAPDLRGHGLSDKPDSLYSMQENVEDIHTVVQALNLPDKFIMLAHSFGGALAASYAAKYPERVEKLITIATPADYSINPAIRVALRSPRLVARLIYQLFPVAVGAPSFVLQLLYRNNMRVWDPDAVFPKVQAPTLVIVGHRDFVFSQRSYDRVAELIPTVQRMTVPVSAHMVMLERADATNRAIERFVGAASVSWRNGRSRANTQLVKQRPWLKHYESDVPYEIAIPRQPLFRFLESAARQWPNRKALVFFDHPVTFRELEETTNRFANALAGLGVKKGDRVILVLPNSPQMVIAYYATLKLGAVVVSANPLFTEDELVRQVNDSGAETLITFSLFQKTAQAVKAKTNLRNVILTNIKEYFSFLRAQLFAIVRETREGHRIELTDDGSTYAWQDLVARASAALPNMPVDPDDLAVIQYTGGTTDVPKGVMLSHWNLVANTLQVRHWISD
ncbi:MAG TPA: alpha/beta fold hydrolase, partial [Anaerolineae bacterium]